MCCVLLEGTTNLSHTRLLFTQSHNNDAVGLADAALGPRCEARVRLVEDNAVDVLLLPQPTGQTVLMDTLEKYKPSRQQHVMLLCHLFVLKY